MNFNSSCSYCCLANMLKDFNIDTEDYKIALDIGLPYIIKHKNKNMSYLCGSSLQDEEIFNLYLKPRGLGFVEELLSRKEIIEIMKKFKRKYMIGLNNNRQRHAYVFLNYDGSNFLFLNPHRENDKEDNYLLVNESQLYKMLDKQSMIGHIVKTDVIKEKDYSLHNNSLKVLNKYKKAIHQFSNQEQTVEGIRNNRDTLLRTFAIDLLVMMELIEDKELLNLLRKFQKECLTLFRTNKNVIPSKIIDLNNFDLIIELYKMVQCQG